MSGLVYGNLRTGSSNAALLKTALELLPDDVSAELYDGLATLPHFDPDDDTEARPLYPAVLKLRRHIGEADALLFSIPEYAGALPGSFKNLLDWTVGGEIYRKPVVWINAATLAAPMERHFVKDGGRIHDLELQKVLTKALTILTAYVYRSRLLV